MKAPFALAVLLCTAASQGAPELVVSGDHIVTATIEGTPGRMRIDPGAIGMPLITADLATRAKLKPGMFGIGYGVGTSTVFGRTAVVKIDTGAGADKHRIGWTQRAYAADVDGVISPAALPQPVIRFVLREARSGERTAILPMVDGGGLFGSFSGLFTTLDVDGEPIRVRFDPFHTRSLATAGAAQRIAATHKGALNGDVQQQEIAFGITRPVRTMTLAEPIHIGGLSIAMLGVRTNDFGTAHGIADADQHVDPDEVLVTAKGKKRNRDHDRMTLGRDQLDHCSSIVFDKPAKQIRLTCG